MEPTRRHHHDPDTDVLVHGSPPLSRGRALIVATGVVAVVVLLSGRINGLTTSAAGESVPSHPATLASVAGAAEPFVASGTLAAIAYAPGGSVYNEQVPWQASATANPYAPGGSVYDEQVPWQASATANPYAPGGSVYDEQVPSRAAEAAHAVADLITTSPRTIHP